MTELAGKTVWITGASSGIGAAMALLASTRGARRVLTARRRAELERVRAACPHPQAIAVLPLDLTQFHAAVARKSVVAGKRVSVRVDLVVGPVIQYRNTYQPPE